MSNQPAAPPSVAAVLAAHYTDDIQISRGQASVVGAAIASAGARARVLVFGCGNDSPMWAAMNPGGRTVFLENHTAWLAQARERFPGLEIEPIDYAGRTVETSLPIDEAALAAFPVPPIVVSEPWDVILIDSPMGTKPHMPGRSLPIWWASQVARPACHIFVDDYRRALERAYADHFFRARRPWSIEVPRVFRHGIRNAGVMFWSVGV